MSKKQGKMGGFDRFQAPKAGVRYSPAPIQEHRGGQDVAFHCLHEKPTGRMTVTVFGLELNFKGSDLCQQCAEVFLNQNSTVCASCGRPILPGMEVGQAWRGAPHPYTHLLDRCCGSGALFCGMWGNGRLITLHELYPEKFPPGTATVMSAVVVSGHPRMVVLGDE
jgi:hypothetical protein